MKNSHTLDIYSKKQRWKQILFLSAILIGVSSLWYTNRLVEDIEITERQKMEVKRRKNRAALSESITERQKMEVWAEAVRIVTGAGLETELAFPFSVIENNTHIPVILTDSQGEIISPRNFDPIKSENPKYLYRQLEHARVENDSIVIHLGSEEYQLLFYRDSFLLRQLKYFPPLYCHALLRFSFCLFWSPTLLSVYHERLSKMRCGQDYPRKRLTSWGPPFPPCSDGWSI